MKYKFVCIIILCWSMMYFSLKAQSNLDSIAWEIDVEDVIVTAQYAPTHYKNVVHAVKVIKAKDIQRQGQNNLAEVLQNQLNLRVNADPILGNGLKIQGIGGENIMIMIDGVPVIGRLNGNIDLSQILLSNVKRIEVIEGAMSAQYGSNASGGLINVITKKTQLEKLRIESQNQWEDIGIQNNSLTIGGKIEGFNISATASRYSSQLAPVDSLRIFEIRETADGTAYNARLIPWNPKEQMGLEGNIAYRFSDSVNINFQSRYFDEELIIYGDIKRPQFRPYAFDDKFHTIRQDHSLQFSAYLNENWYLKSTTAYNQYDRIKEALRLDIEPDTISIVPNAQDTSQFNSFLQRASISSVFNSKWNVQVGIEAFLEDGSGGRIVDSTSAPLNEANLDNYALWLGLKYQADTKWNASFNLRYGYNSKYNHPLIPSFHLAWQTNQNWRMKWSYALGFRAPSLKELHFNFIDTNHNIVGNPDLKAEYSQNANWSIQYDKKMPYNHRIEAKAKAFYNQIEDRIVLATYEPNKFNYQNLDEFQTYGFNLTFSYAIPDLLSFSSGFAYTYLYNAVSEEADVKRFVPLSEMQNQLNIDIPFIDAHWVTTHRFIGKQVTFLSVEDGVEQGYIGSYHFLNTTLSKSFWKDQITLALGSKNILDVQSVGLSGQAGGVHSSAGDTQIVDWGRTYFVRIQLNVGVL